jgi:hypothetical protein
LKKQSGGEWRILENFREELTTTTTRKKKKKKKTKKKNRRVYFVGRKSEVEMDERHFFFI